MDTDNQEQSFGEEGVLPLEDLLVPGGPLLGGWGEVFPRGINNPIPGRTDPEGTGFGQICGYITNGGGAFLLTPELP